MRQRLFRFGLYVSDLETVIGYTEVVYRLVTLAWPRTASDGCVIIARDLEYLGSVLIHLLCILTLCPPHQSEHFS